MSGEYSRWVRTSQSSCNNCCLLIKEICSLVISWWKTVFSVNSRHFLWSAAFSWSYWEQYLLELIIWFSRRHRRKVKVFIAQSYLTLRDPTGCTLPSSFVQGIFQARILEWEGNTEGNCHSLLQGIFPTQGSNPGLLHCRQILYQLSHKGSLFIIVSTKIMMHKSTQQLSITWFTKIRKWVEF